jgi:5'-nucleotidase
VKQPLILLSNDDGYHSEGIHVLSDALESLGEVWVVAPDRENSAVSHALTLSRPLRLTQLAERGFAVDGTPTDCVTLGVGQVLKGRAPDLVVSGINFGANMGDDVHYSGTVSAAFEAVILGVPAIAISQVIWHEFSFAFAGRFARLIASRVLARGLPPGTLLNVNVPPNPPKGVRFTRLGKRTYTEGVVEDTDPRGRKCYWIGGGDPVWEDIPGTDFAAVGAGYISVSPLQLDMTDRDQLVRLESVAAAWDLEGS